LKSTTSLAHRGAIERAREEAEDEREPVALVAADRKEQALVERALRIGDRFSLAIDDPALGDRFAALHRGLHLAEGGNRGRHVEHDRRLLLGRDRDRDRIRRQQQVEPAPGRKVVGASHREVEPDHAVLERHARVERGGTGVVAPSRADPGGAGGARLRDRQLGRAQHHEVAHAVVAIYERHRGPLLDDADVRARIHAARAHPPHVVRQPHHAVALGALGLRLHHEARRRARVAGWSPTRSKAAAANDSTFSRGYRTESAMGRLYTVC
jgi:hypothetical protein